MNIITYEEQGELIRDNFINEKKLKELDSGLYRKYNSVIQYLTDRVEVYTLNEIKNDLLGQFFNCYEKGGDINQIISDDLKQYCDDIIDSIPKKKQRRFYIKYIMMFVVNIIVFSIFYKIDNEDGLMTPKFLLSINVFLVVMSIIYDFIINKKRFYNKTLVK